MNPAVLKKVNGIVDKEIKYLSSFYTYDINDYKDQELLHSRSMLVFMDPEAKPAVKQAGKPSFMQYDDLSSRIISLMAGIELLATGLNLHTFNVDDFIAQNIRNDPGLTGKDPVKTVKDSVEKNYTIGLLFGDVFYSRAVVYILEYGDFDIFNSILDSLKSAHKYRLLLHRRFVEYLNSKNIDKRAGQIVDGNEPFITGINSLLRTSFFIGWGIFADPDRSGLPYEIINGFLLLRTINSIGDFFDGILNHPGSSGKGGSLNKKDRSFIYEKARVIRAGLSARIKDLEPSYIKDNFHSLQDLYRVNSFD